MKIKTIITVIFISCSISLFAQQERRVLLYNLGFGGFTSGIGAVINKPKTVNWKKAFAKGFWQGSIGGALNYAGKKTVFLINKNEELTYGWPSKILHAAGTSIVENAALNEPFLQNWNIDYGPIRIDFSVNGKRPFRARLLPVSLYSIIRSSNHASLNLRTSVLTGNLAFKSDADSVYGMPSYTWGTSYGRAYVYVPNNIFRYTVAHELIHLYQYREHQIFNTWLNPLSKKIKSKTLHKIFDRFVYPDIPYFAGIYEMQYRKIGNHYKNFYEFEAERFATNRYVYR